MNDSKHDLVGMYGYWVALPGNKVKNRNKYQLCRCTLCNKTEKYVRITTLKNGESTKCLGCGNKAPRRDISGQQFNRLTALYPTDKRSSSGAVIWVCKCSCVNPDLIEVQSVDLVSGHTQSCGCRLIEYHQKDSVSTNSSHGLYNHEFYRIWSGMVSRCYCETNGSFPRYGARGITVSEEFKDAAVFIKFLENEGYIKGYHHMHREIGEGPYSRENVVIIPAEDHYAIHAEMRRKAA